jgi:hypothetical protein
MTPYKRGTHPEPYISVPDAAVDWQGLEPAEWRYVFLDDIGLPRHLEQLSLHERARALLNAAYDKEIRGRALTEDGSPLPVRAVRLFRDSVVAWIAANRYNIGISPDNIQNDDDI